jgi:hypothetical protein
MLQQMEWQVRIEGHNKERILITFEPRREMIFFRGQYSIKNNWITFSVDAHPMEIDLETIQSMISKVYDKMNERLKVYLDLDKSFNIIKEITIEGEELPSSAVGTISDNSVFGTPITDVDGWRIVTPPITE